ncbi:MAG TPA: LysE family translocator [Steroidobacteraceae bacterium]|nr:LysE family translocator [Steroidobacteraceae bacterium]
MTSASLAAFLAASLVLALTPGPGVLYIVSRAVQDGRRAGLASVAGVACGNLCNALGASIGLAAVFAVSALAFTLVKYLGAAYLIFLGLRTWYLAMHSATGSASQGVSRPTRSRHAWRDGLFVALLNPKTTIFFAAFLPQFLDPTASSWTQCVELGAAFVAIAAITDSAYALLASALIRFLARSPAAGRAGRWLSGGTLIGLGIFTAASGARNLASA